MGVQVNNNWWRTRGAGKLSVSPAFYLHPLFDTSLVDTPSVMAITHADSNPPHSDASARGVFYLPSK